MTKMSAASNNKSHKNDADKKLINTMTPDDGALGRCSSNLFLVQEWKEDMMMKTLHLSVIEVCPRRIVSVMNLPHISVLVYPKSAVVVEGQLQRTSGRTDHEHYAD